MRKLRYAFLFISAFLKRFKTVLLLAVGVGVSLFFILKWVAPLIIPGPTQKIGIVGKYRLDSLPEEIVSTIGEGLTKIDNQGIVLPGLASSWETTDKGQTWTFHLGDDAYWQDGKKVEASQIVYNFSDATTEAIDEKTIVFTLQSPFAPFPSVVSQPTFRKGLLGTGEWEVKKASVAGNFVQRLTLQNEKGQRKIIKFYPTEERAKLALKLGSVDTLEDIFTKNPFSDWKTVSVVENVKYYRYVGIFFNIQDKYLSEKNLRQALAYGIDKTKMPGPRAYGPISPDSWAYNSQVKPYDFDPKRAAEIVNDLPDEFKEGLTIKLVTTPVLLASAELVAKNWNEIGVATQVQVSSVVPSEFQALLAIFDIPKDPDQYSIWHSTQTSTNISKYQNPRIDKLLEDGRIQLNQEERKKIYLDFQRFLIEDSPAIFLYHPVSFTINRN